MVPIASRSGTGPASAADFEFEGVYENRVIRWHCHLVTLAGIAAHTGQALQRQFIEIDPQPLSHDSEIPQLKITVGLNVPAIDDSVIEKTIIMIRNYKRLRSGRHEYGEQVTITPD